MTTIDALGDLRGKRVLVRSDLNVPLRRPDGTITDDGRIRASRADHRRPCADAGARVVVVRPPRPPEGRARGRSTRWRPVADAARRAARPPGRLRHRHGRRVGAQAAVAGARRRRRRAAGEPPLQPGRDQPRTTPSAARSPTQLAALADAFVTDGFGVVHRKQASVYDVAAAAAARRRRAGRSRGRGAASGSPSDPERPYAVVLGGVQGLRQARRHRQPAAAPPTGCSSAAAWSSPSSRPRATRSARACSRPTRSTRSGATSPSAAERGVEIVLPIDIVVADARSPPTPSHEVVAADAIPADRLGLDIGPESGAALRRRSSPTPGRSSGTARWACSRWRRSPPAPARSPQALDRGRRA